MSEVQEPLYTSSKPTHPPHPPHRCPTMCHRGEKKPVLQVCMLSFQLKCWLAAFYQPTNNIWYIKTDWKNKVFVAGSRRWSYRPNSKTLTAVYQKNKAVLLASLVPCKCFIYLFFSLLKHLKRSTNLIWCTDNPRSQKYTSVHVYCTSTYSRKVMFCMHGHTVVIHGYYSCSGTIVVMPTTKITQKQQYTNKYMLMCRRDPTEISTERNKQ